MDRGPQFPDKGPPEIDPEKAPGYRSYQHFSWHDRNVGWVRADMLKRYREWNRSTPLSRDNPEGHSYSPEEWQQNVDDIKEHGIKNPLIVHYNAHTHQAIVGEGNHRLEWATEAGHKYVPVRVTSSNAPDYMTHRFKSSHNVLGDKRVNTDQHVPADMHPRNVFPDFMLPDNILKPKLGREVVIRDAEGNRVGRD